MTMPATITPLTPRRRAALSGVLPSEFVARLVARIEDPVGRTDGLDPSPTTSFLGGAFETRRVQLGDGPPPSPPPLPPPATDDEVASARASFGFALPPDLEDLYRRVGNGGFGPDGGLAPLERRVGPVKMPASGFPENSQTCPSGHPISSTSSRHPASVNRSYAAS